MPEHIHKLKKHKYKNGTAIFFCVIDCDYKIDAALALGKIVLCHMCNEPFTMNEYSVKLARPHCSGCGRTQITDENGKRKFVPKEKANPITAGLGTIAIDNLRQRLAGTVVQMEKQPDEDI